MIKAKKKDERYNVEFICTANACRSRMAQAEFGRQVIGTGLEGKVKVTSSGIQVDKINNWGIETNYQGLDEWGELGSYFDFGTNFKVISAAYRSGLYDMSGCKDIVEQVMDDPKKAEQYHDQDKDYKDEINRVAKNLYVLVEQLDIAATRVVLAQNGLVYPTGDPVQFYASEGRGLCVAMEKKHEPMIKEHTIPDSCVVCIDDFIVGEMKGSLNAISFDPVAGILDVSGHREIYLKVRQCCANLIDYMVDHSNGRL